MKPCTATATRARKRGTKLFMVKLLRSEIVELDEGKEIGSLAESTKLTDFVSLD